MMVSSPFNNWHTISYWPDSVKQKTPCLNFFYRKLFFFHPTPSPFLFLTFFFPKNGTFNFYSRKPLIYGAEFLMTSLRNLLNVIIEHHLPKKNYYVFKNSFQKQKKSNNDLDKLLLLWLLITNPLLHLQIGLQRFIDTKLFRTIIKKIHQYFTNALTYCTQDTLHYPSSTCAHAREGEREREGVAQPFWH